MSSGGTIASDGLTGQKERDDRVFATLVDVGPSVCSHLSLEWMKASNANLYWIGSLWDNFHQADWD